MTIDDIALGIAGDRRNKVIFTHIDDKNVFFIVSELTPEQLRIPSMINGRVVEVLLYR